MKKITALLLCLSLLLLGTACSAEEPVPTTTHATTPTESTPVPTSQPTQPVQAYQAPLLAFSAPVVTQDFYDDERKVVLFTNHFQNISLVLEDPQIADAVTLDLLNRVDHENSTVRNILSDAQATYSGQSDWVPYSFSTVFHPQRFDQSILSLYGTQAIYSGSPRPTSVNLSVTYDLLSGRLLELKDILVSDFSADALCALIVDALSGPAGEGILYSDYAYVVSDLFATNKPADTWYLSGSGLCFYFAPYEIAPYSAGTVIAEVSYQDLTGLLRDEYFPAETVALSGNVIWKAFDSADQDVFTQFAELILDSSGAEYLLYTDGTLQNVRLETGTWLSDGSFIPNTTVFAAAALCSADALMLQLEADTAQNLRLSYESDGNLVFCDMAAFLLES